jgi:hypothetical protein
MKPELESALKRLLEKLTLPSVAKKGKAMDVLNSPFVITLLGGVVLALISGTLTQCNASAAKDREIALDLLHRKQNFIDTFASKIELYLNLTLGLRKREMFLAAWAKVPDHGAARFSDGRTFEETRAIWEADKRFWIEHSTGTTPFAVIKTAKILFSKTDVLNKPDDLDNSIDEYGSVTTVEDLENAYRKVLHELADTTSTLAKESYEK